MYKQAPVISLCKARPSVGMGRALIDGWNIRHPRQVKHEEKANCFKHIGHMALLMHQCETKSSDAAACEALEIMPFQFKITLIYTDCMLLVIIQTLHSLVAPEGLADSLTNKNKLQKNAHIHYFF